jgi:hypothetical protein
MALYVSDDVRETNAALEASTGYDVFWIDRGQRKQAPMARGTRIITSLDAIL